MKNRSKYIRTEQSGGKTRAYIKPGTYPEIGIEVLEIAEDAGRAERLSYNVRNLCCTGGTVMSHYSIVSRINKGRGECLTCAAKARRKVSPKWHVFAMGEMPECNLHLHEIVQNGDTQDTVRYRATYLCCDAEIIVTHKQLMMRRVKQSPMCIQCTAMMRKRDQEELPLQVDMDRIIPYRPEWPAPSWIPRGAHVIWEDGMRHV